MAKGTVKTSQSVADEAAKGRYKAPERFSASMTDAEVIELCKEGAKFEFAFEDFRELPGDVLDELHRESLEAYYRERALFVRKRRREADEAEYGPTARIEVLGSDAGARVRVDGMPEYLHPCWKMPEEVDGAKRAGYITVDGRFPEVIAGDRTASGTHEIKKPDGKAELVLMALPQERFEGHLEATARASRSRAKGSAARFENKAKAISKDVKVKSEQSSEKVRMKG